MCSTSIRTEKKKMSGMLAEVYKYNLLCDVYTMDDDESGGNFQANGQILLDAGHRNDLKKKPFNIDEPTRD